MANTLVKIRSDTKEVVLSSFCFFNESELKQMGLELDKPFKQNGINYIYQLLNGEK